MWFPVAKECDLIMVGRACIVLGLRFKHYFLGCRSQNEGDDQIMGRGGTGGGKASEVQGTRMGQAQGGP